MTTPRAGIAGILLTGGRSRRLGVDKARVVVDGETLAVRAAHVLGAVCDSCIEVGSGASKLRCVREQPPGAGPLAALLAGVDAIDALGAPADAVLVLACDYPAVSEELVRVIAEHAAPTVVPVVEGHAQFVCAKYGAEVLTRAREQRAAGERGFRWLLDEPEGTIEWADASVWGSVASAASFRDIDTPADAAALGIDIGND